MYFSTFSTFHRIVFSSFLLFFLTHDLYVLMLQSTLRLFYLWPFHKPKDKSESDQSIGIFLCTISFCPVLVFSTGFSPCSCSLNNLPGDLRLFPLHFELLYPAGSWFSSIYGQARLGFHGFFFLDTAFSAWSLWLLWYKGFWGRYLVLKGVNHPCSSKCMLLFPAVFFWVRRCRQGANRHPSTQPWGRPCWWCGARPCWPMCPCTSRFPSCAAC